MQICLQAPIPCSIFYTGVGSVFFRMHLWKRANKVLQMTFSAPFCIPCLYFQLIQRDPKHWKLPSEDWQLEIDLRLDERTSPPYSPLSLPSWWIFPLKLHQRWKKRDFTAGYGILIPWTHYINGGQIPLTECAPMPFEFAGARGWATLWKPWPAYWTCFNRSL